MLIYWQLSSSSVVVAEAQPGKKKKEAFIYCMSTWIHLLQHTYIIDFKIYFMIPSLAIQVWHFRLK